MKKYNPPCFKPSNTLLKAKTFGGNKGKLESILNSSSNSVILNDTDNAGTYGNLVVTEDKDFYAGIEGKSNFWNVLIIP